MNYVNLKDDELIAAYQNGELDAAEVLLERYKGLVRAEARKMIILGSDYDDLIQEGMIGLIKAVRSFNGNKYSCFSAYAQLCVRRQLYSLVRNSKTKKNIPLNTYISLYGAADDDFAGESLVDTLADSINDNPETTYIGDENVRNIEDYIRDNLSSMERQVMELYITGMNLTEIAEIIEKETKVADNALQRARNKIKKYLEIVE